MTFPTTETKIPTKIGTIRIHIEQLFVPDQTIVDMTTGNSTFVPEHIENSMASLIEVLDQNDSVIFTWHGELINHLSDPQKAALQQFSVDIRAKALAELIG